VTDETRRRYHEAAHAVVAVAFGRRLESVTVVGGSHWLGLTVHLSVAPSPEAAAAYAADVAELAKLEAEIAAMDAADPDAAPPPPPIRDLWPPVDRAATEAQMVVTLAGPAADELLGTMDGYHEESPDEIAADALAVNLARQSPRHTELVSEHVEASPDSVRALAQSEQLAGPEAIAHFHLMRAVARRMVAERWPQIHALAEALRTQPILDGAAAELIIETARKGQKGT